MNLLERMHEAGDFEQVIALHDPSSGLRGFMVLHDTSRGPATGGVRLYPYRSEVEALSDGFRLARAMTFKAAAAELRVGGGKIVLLQHPELERDEALRAVGRAIQTMGGRFLAGRDVGVPVPDGRLVASETDYMVDETEQGVGDLNRATAIGVAAGARAAVRARLGVEGFEGIRVAIQGAGGVGAWLAKILSEAGAELAICDPDDAALEKLREAVPFRRVEVDAIYGEDSDVFAPCAIGGVLDEHTVPRLRAKVVAGSANNVLASPEVGALLFERSIVYAPDFLVNAGALIQGVRFFMHKETSSPEAIGAIFDRTAALLARSDRDGVPPESLLTKETTERIRDRAWRNWFVPGRS